MGRVAPFAAGAQLALRMSFGFLTRGLSRVLPEQSALYRTPLGTGVPWKYAGQRMQWVCDVIRAMHKAGPALRVPSWKEFA